MAKIKQGEKDYLEEHSKEKVKFYKKYLDLYLTVLLNSRYTKTINIYDIFCGVGIYEGDGSKGSPIVAMESIKYKLQKYGSHNNKSIKLLINDGDEKRVSIASDYIENNFENMFEFTSLNLHAQEVFPLVIDKITKSKNSENHLVFIDPHGYKEIYSKDIVNIMKAGKSEILIFLPIHQMYQFSKGTMKVKTNSSEKNPLKRFIIEFKLNYNANSTKDYIEYLNQSFTFDGKYLTTYYRLKASNSNNIYALFFITKNLKGLEKAVETKWKLDELCGQGFERIKQQSLFELENNENKKEDCRKILDEKLKKILSEERDNNELYEFTLVNGFELKHTNDILKSYQAKGMLKFNSDDRNRKNSFYLSYEYYKNNDIKYKVKINNE